MDHLLSKEKGKHEPLFETRTKFVITINHSSLNCIKKSKFKEFSHLFYLVLKDFVFLLIISYDFNLITGPVAQLVRARA